MAEEDCMFMCRKKLFGVCVTRTMSCDSKVIDFLMKFKHEDERTIMEIIHEADNDEEGIAYVTLREDTTDSDLYYLDEKYPDSVVFV